MSTRFELDETKIIYSRVRYLERLFHAKHCVGHGPPINYVSQHLLISLKIAIVNWESERRTCPVLHKSVIEQRSEPEFLEICALFALCFLHVFEGTKYTCFSDFGFSRGSALIVSRAAVSLTPSVKKWNDRFR